MMLIEKARLLLWDKYEDLSDGDIQKLIDMLKSICSIVVECYIQEKESK